MAQPSRRRSRPSKPTQSEPRSRRGVLLLAAAALVLVCAVLGAIAVPGQQRKPETSLRASTLTAPSTGPADSAAKTPSGAKPAASSSRRSRHARRSHKLRPGGEARQHKARRMATFASTRRSSPAQDTRSDTNTGNGATNSSYVSTGGEESVGEHAASAVEQPPSTASSDSADSVAAGPSGLGAAVGGNCNPKCS